MGYQGMDKQTCT